MPAPPLAPCLFPLGRNRLEFYALLPGNPNQGSAGGLLAWVGALYEPIMEVNWKSCLDHAALTDVGMRRANNQDSSAVALASDADAWFKRGHMFVVCDGMGAHAAGELASKLAAETIPFTYQRLLELPPADALRNSVREANSNIHRRGQAHAEFHGMGTTASALVLLPQGALVAHVGDSRVYRLRGSTLEQLTFDHSLVWEMSASGQVAKEDLPSCVPKNIITRSLGPHPEVQVDVEGPFPVQVGDTFLLCSDGLSGQVNDEEIGAIMGCLPPSEAGRVLIDLANLRGGPDNITAIVLQVTGQELATPASSELGPLAVTQELYESHAQPRNPRLLWVLAGICLLAAIGLFFAALTIPALVSAGAAIVVGALAMLPPKSQPLSELRHLAPGAKLGRGPYTKAECQPSESLVATLGRLVEQLRDAATEGNWALDWSKFNTYSRQGAMAAEKREYAQAIRDYSRALRSMMNELRNQRTKKRTSDDESVLGY